ncbi:restriction endonuclease subunit S [Clostridium algidicarnis]|uniref:restriction endonuclease subunit S n=1 Tax=Clostridium algidicarnis TaxID=37659 RepID=UPI001C0D0631|nr:restriction endonuclease subunit S [Clostridium algidicarnis]MBU3227089.1 restriction endonuclease subunit S [Clostridium algidicarnis]MBU3250614.1 restriction endonuclease subunit S [Clostridium algidicarnis]
MSFKDTEVGRIPQGWEVKMIQEIGEVVSGGTPKTKETSYWDGNISWITPKDLSNFNERYIDTGERSITEEGLKNSSARLLPKGTVLFSSRAPIGYVVIAKKELCTNQGFKNIVCDKRFSDNQFIYYMMINKKNEIENIAGGSTFKEVSGKVVKEFKIPIPSLQEQKSIAHILSTLDAKIEINNKINDNLEQMAQAIFKQWFVDFEFPNEEGEPYKSSGGEMVESEMGMIPKGWEVKRLCDLGKIITGKTPATKDTDNFGDEYNFITPKDINNQVYIIKSERQLSEIGAQKIIKNKISENSIAVTCIGSNLGEVYINSEIGFTNQQINSIKLADENLYPYIFIILKNMKEEFLSISGGSAVPIINKTTFSKIKILIPKQKSLMKFLNIGIPILELIKDNLKQNYKLVFMRDALLPKLMLGEIDVSKII